MVERQEVGVSTVGMKMLHAKAVRHASGQWVIHIDMQYEVELGSGRSLVGRQVVKMTKGELRIAPGHYRSQKPSTGRARTRLSKRAAGR